MRFTERLKGLNFNSRPSARGDIMSDGRVDITFIIISIHAPPRGATATQ